MGKKYEYNKNPILDIFVDISKEGYDFVDKDSQKKIYDTLVYVIGHALSERIFINYLDYDIKTYKDVYVEFIPKNILTALWLCGIIPKDSLTTLTNNYFEYKNNKYTFDDKKKKIINNQKKVKNE